MKKDFNTFENFIVGNSNRIAVTAAFAVTQSPASAAYNPLFIHSSSGLGKTHLLHAICQEAQKRFPQSSIVYVNGEEFTNKFIESIDKKKTAVFKNYYRSCDILLIDDIQFIHGKKSTQNEILYTFDSLINLKKQLVFASDRLPRDIVGLENRLRSRFESGLIVNIDPPDFELRVAILRHKAELLGIVLPDDVVDYIATNLTANVRQLEGAVKKLYALSSSGETINIFVTKKLLSEYNLKTTSVAPSVDKILRAVCAEFGITADEIRSRSRSVRYTIPRHTAAYLIRNNTNMSYPAIGKLFNRDHSSVISSVEKAEAMLSADPEYKERVDKILAKIQ